MNEEAREDIILDDQGELKSAPEYNEENSAGQDSEAVDSASATTDEPKGQKKFFQKKETVSLAKYQELEASLNQAMTEVDSLKESRLRLMAEYENFKRRTQKEKDHLYGESLMDVTRDWLPVLDNLERAARAVDNLNSDSDEKTIQNVADGVELIRKQAVEVMEKLGVKEIDALGKPFDPAFHEAVMRVESDELDKDTVVEVFAKGYIYGDRVIRHSVVKVAN
ncbi:MAG: nucleotide exchange factor GrpE [Clostridia bacterium]|nr:nucleotide exchange factor GrpE [Clostridia bacterium]NLF21280.1 nucleotide exchange factor GrpE [Clostridiaceae bacterium]